MSQPPLGKETLAILQILSAGILWGLVGPLVKMMELHGSTAASTSFIRMLFAFLIMTAFTAMKFGPKALIVDKRTLVACAVLGVVSNGIYNMFYTMAIANAGIAVSAVLLNTAPIFTTVFSMLIFHEGISLLKVIALCINVVGCSLAATGGQLNLETLSVLGVSCGIASGFTYGMAAIITRIAGKRHQYLRHECLQLPIRHYFCSDPLPTMDLSRIVQRRNHSLWIFTGLDSYFAGIPAVLQGYFEDEGNEQSPHHRFRRNDCYRHHKCCVLRRVFVPCRHLRHCAGCCLYCPNERQDKRTAPIERTRLACTTVTTFRRIFSWHKSKAQSWLPLSQSTLRGI